MVRISKVAEIRQVSPRRRKAPARKTGPLKDNLPKGYREHPNALSGPEAGGLTKTHFIPKIK